MALFLVGLGNGPMYPNFMHLTPANFGREYSQSAMASQVTAAYASILITPLLFGFLAQTIGTHILPFFLGTLVLVLLLCTIYTRHKLKNKK